MKSWPRWNRMPLMHLLGSFLMQLFGGSVEEVEIHYSG